MTTTTGLDTKLLASYLNDHLAGATAALELARRARGENEGNAYGSFLAQLVAEIEEDRETLVAIMDALGVGRDRVKVAAGWLGEKVGRLKTNGRLLGYSPLSRAVELEALLMGVTAKRGLWVALRELEERDGRLAQFDFAALIERAERQWQELERRRLEAAREALVAG